MKEEELEQIVSGFRDNMKDCVRDGYTFTYINMLVKMFPPTQDYSKTKYFQHLVDYTLDYYNGIRQSFDSDYRCQIASLEHTTKRVIQDFYKLNEKYK